jgi:hypothetical protein
MKTLDQPQVLVLLVTLVLVAGCRRQEEAAPAALPVAKAPSAPVAPVPPTSPAAPPGPAPAQAVSPKDANATAYAGYIQELEQTMTDLLGEYIRKHKRTPKDINEMMSLGVITSIPPAPAGKKWVIDQQTGKVSAR